MTALSAAGGAAVVQAAGTDAWSAFRDRLARWFGRGNGNVTIRAEASGSVAAGVIHGGVPIERRRAT